MHLDVTYLPLINGKKYYLFVAIDRATRTIYYKAIIKWKELEPDIFNQNIDDFKEKIVNLNRIIKTCSSQQPCETKHLIAKHR